MSNREFVRSYREQEWTVIQIVEHLCLIEEAYMREFFVALHLPTFESYDTKTIKYHFSEKMKAKEAYEPIGRFSTKSIALKAFAHDRDIFIAQVRECTVDLSKVFTYRDQKPFQTLFDMVVLNCEHTNKHVNQIKKLMSS